MLKIVLAAIVPAVFMAAPAIAAPALADASTSVVVAFADLDLARGDHKAELAQRIERAAADACHRPNLRDLKGMVAFEKCVGDATAIATRELVERQTVSGLELAAR
jgi:UrcA family protein